MVADYSLNRLRAEKVAEDAKPDYVVTVESDGRVFIQCNRPMIPSRAVELAKLLVKVAGNDGDELLPMGAIR